MPAGSYSFAGVFMGRAGSVAKTIMRSKGGGGGPFRRITHSYAATVGPPHALIGKVRFWSQFIGECALTDLLGNYDFITSQKGRIF